MESKLASQVEGVRRTFDQLSGRHKALQERLVKARRESKILDRHSLLIAEGQVLAQKVAKRVQDELCFRITKLVSLALAAVFPDPYEFVVRFEEKRGKTEALLMVVRNGEEIDPYDAAGGGVVDVISFALRICMWRLMEKPSRNVLVLDEPFRFVSRDLQPKVGRMLSEVSRKLGLQMIIVTHEEELVEHADKVYFCERRNRVSEVSGSEEEDGEETDQ
jgi:hypothetical protein